MRMFFLSLFVILLLLCGYVAYYPENGFDQQIMIFIQQMQVNALVQLALGLAYVGSLWVTVILMLLLTGYSFIKRYKLEVYLGVLGLLLTTSMIWLLKWSFSRPRPFIENQIVDTYGSSFPSAHSAYAAMIACMLIMSFARRSQYSFWIWGLAILWAVIMGWSRIYLEVHYPTDVLAGWIVAVLMMLVVKSGLNKLRDD